MNRRLSKKQKWFKEIVLTEEDELYVGLDVHKKSDHVAIWLNGRTEITFVMPANNEKVVAMLERVKVALKQVAYEAGPTGFGLAQALQRAQLPIIVAAPSKTPRQSAPDSKSDRLDCRQLAEYASKGLLKPVFIPTEQQEVDRQLARLRDQQVAKHRRVRQQINADFRRGSSTLILEAT